MFHRLLLIPFLLCPVLAQAQGLIDVVENINELMMHSSNLIVMLAYVTGSAIGVGGIFKLRMHFDNPQQVPLKEALIRIFASGMLIAMPLVMDLILKVVNESQEEEEEYVMEGEVLQEYLQEIQGYSDESEEEEEYFEEEDYPFEEELYYPE